MPTGREYSDPDTFSNQKQEALANKQSEQMGFPIDPEQEIVITCGGTEAMMAARMTIVNPGDKVGAFF